MGWACAPTVIYNAFRLQKRAKKSHKDCVAPGSGPPGPPSAESLSLSRSLSTDDSGSENNSSVFNQDDDMQYQIELMDQREPQRCPCGCPGMQNDERDSVRVRTKEVVNRPNTSTGSSTTDSVDRVFPVGVLRFQGRHHCAEEIAPLWKKDCRTWLWKCADNAKSKQVVNDKEQQGC